MDIKLIFTKISI